MVNLNWFTENNYEECGSILTQDEYGIVYEVMVQGVRSKVKTLDFLTYHTKIKFLSMSLTQVFGMVN